MADSMQIDFTQFNAATKRLMQMDRVKARDIERVFRNANRPMVSFAKSTAHRSKHGAYSLQYASRTHTAGTLRKGIVFKASRKYKLMYWVISKAWYTAIYGSPNQQKRRYEGHQFIKIAWSNTGRKVGYWVRDGLGKLIKTAWNG